jgi:hypothetical protein
MGIALVAPLRRPGCLRSRRNDDVGLERDYLCREAGEAIGLAFGPSPFNGNVLTVDVAQVTQPLAKPVPGRVVLVAENSDPLHLLGLLSFGEKRRQEANGKNDREPDPPHTHLGSGWLAGSLAERHGAHQHVHSSRLAKKRSHRWERSFLLTGRVKRSGVRSGEIGVRDPDPTARYRLVSRRST